MSTKKNNKIKSPKNDFLNSHSYKLLFRISYFIFAWNCIAIVFIIINSINQKNLKLWNINFGDLARTDLGYLIALNNFGTPYAYHPELPNITITNYLPIPFLVTKILGVHLVEDWNKNSFQVLSFTLFSMFLLFLIPFYFTKGYPQRSRFLFSVTFGVISVPSLYIFSTANIQGILTFVLFLGFIPYLISGLVSSDKKTSVFMRLTSFIIIGASKPQYLAVNSVGFISKTGLKIQQLIWAFLGTLLFILIGFAAFTGGVAKNFGYFSHSLRGFTNTSPAYFVHFNDSLLGNLFALEVFLDKKSLENSFVLGNQNTIIFIYVLITLIVAFWLFKLSSPLWIITWLIGGLPAVIIPVSYAYSYTLFLIPLGMLFYHIRIEPTTNDMLFKSRYNQILLALSLFCIFSPKILYFILVNGVADTRLYSMFSSLGHSMILILAFRYLIISRNINVN